MCIFQDPVTSIQAIGYSIALGGLLYYKLGGDKIKEYTRQGSNAWQDYGVRHPIVRRLIVIGMVLLTGFVLLSGIMPTYSNFTLQESWTPNGGSGIGSGGVSSPTRE